MSFASKVRAVAVRSSVSLSSGAQISSEAEACWIFTSLKQRITINKKIPPVFVNKNMKIERKSQQWHQSRLQKSARPGQGVTDTHKTVFSWWRRMIHPQFLLNFNKFIFKRNFRCGELEGEFVEFCEAVKKSFKLPSSIPISNFAPYFCSNFWSIIIWFMLCSWAENGTALKRGKEEKRRSFPTDAEVEHALQDLRGVLLEGQDYLGEVVEHGAVDVDVVAVQVHLRVTTNKIKETFPELMTSDTLKKQPEC